MTYLAFDGSIWTKVLERAYSQNQIVAAQAYHKNAAFMGFDENYVFSLSNSDGDSKSEDCGLMVWNANTLIIPSKDVGIKKNHYGKERNCIYPTLRADGPTYLYVLVVAEYM